MRHYLIALTAAVALGLAASAGAQTISYNLRSGDVWVDNRLGEVNDYGVRYREPFVNEMVTYYDAPRPLVVDLLGSRRWAPGDVYYACALAHSLGRPCVEVVERYERNRGGGWGAVAQSYGIRPGSPQFFAFKRGFVGTYGRWGHRIAIDRDTHVRWDERSIRSDRQVGYKVKYKHGHAYGHERHDGEHDRGEGHAKHDHDNGHDKEHGKGRGEGHAKDHDKGHDNDNGHGHGHK